jgi:hypothetical protein
MMKLFRALGYEQSVITFSTPDQILASRIDLLTDNIILKLFRLRFLQVVTPLIII